MSRSSGRARQNAAHCNHDVWDIVQAGTIHNIRRFVGKMLYEGCPRLLADGRSCELGKSARRERQSHGGLPDTNSRGRDDHVCVVIGQGVPMFNFVVDMDDIEDIDVYNVPGEQLFGMSGQQWDRAYGPTTLPSIVVDRIESKLWTIKLVT